jgi:tetratricopeptide (TPR) repeat protein
MIISYISPKDAKTTADDEELPRIRVIAKGVVSEEKLPPEVERLNPYFLEHLQDNPEPTVILQEVLPTLKRLLEKYPTHPVLSTYLSLAFDQLGEYEKAEALIEKQYRVTPRYPLALLNYCFFLLDKNRLTEIPEVLGHKFTLQEVFPEKKEFHIVEVVSFMAVMALYQDSLGHSAAAKE